MADPLPAPTKTNLFREKHNLELATQGYDLLEKKREILVLELLGRLDALELAEKELRERIDRAYAALKGMLIAVGRERAREISNKPVRDIRLQETTVQVGGMAIPSMHAEAGEIRLSYSFLNSFALVDETVVQFSELVQLLAASAGLRSVVWRLAREVRRTQRRVNALDTIVIPRARSAVTFILASLEERERENLFAIKQLKLRLLQDGGSAEDGERA
ncbi:MAG: V-type ATP synthase subunit D [Rectinemataceae bacterium]